MANTAPRSPTLAGGFEAAFRLAARRVLERRGFPAAYIEAEIDRLRALSPGLSLPTVEELEAQIDRRT
jgi:hypothetical protein